MELMPDIIRMKDGSNGENPESGGYKELMGHIWFRIMVIMVILWIFQRVNLVGLLV